MIPLTTSLVTLSLLLLSLSTSNAELSNLLHEQLLSIDSVAPSSDNSTWLLSTHNFTVNSFQIQPYVSNGYIGIRLPVEGTGYIIDNNQTNGWPLQQPRYTGAYLAGFWDLQPSTPQTNYPELLARGAESVISTIPVWSSLFVAAHGDIYMPGVVDTTKIQNYTQTMNLRDGTVRTRMKWLPKNEAKLAIWLDFEVIAHRSIPTLGMVRLEVTSAVDTEVTVIDVLDMNGSFRTVHLASNYSAVDGTGIWTGVRPYGLYTSAYEFSHLEFSDRARVNMSSRSRSSLFKNSISQQFKINLTSHTTFTTYKYVGVASLDSYKSPKRAAAYTARAAAAVGYRLLRASHELGWRRLWESADIEVPSSPEWQLAVRASLFHLLSAVRNESSESIMVSGLSSDSYAGMIVCVPCSHIFF